MARITKIVTPQDIPENSQSVLLELKAVIDRLNPKKAEILLYWIDTWKRYIVSEDTADYSKLPHYKRGTIIQAHLGFKVGNEQGGLHYAIVVENDNPSRSGTVMAIPIRSLKDSESPEDIRRDELFLGYDLFANEIPRLQESLSSIVGRNAPANKQRRDLEKKIRNYSRGSVAIINQMCAISKLRIYHPRFKDDELSQIKLSPEIMDNIDSKIIEKFTKFSQAKMLTK